MKLVVTAKQHNSALYIFLFIAVILLSSDSLLVGTNQSGIAIALAKYLPFAFIAILVCVACIKEIPINGKAFLAAGVLVIVLIINYIAASGENSIKNYAHIIALIVDAFFLCSLLQFKVFIKLFEKSIFLIAAFSLIVYIVVILFPQIVSSFPVITNTAGNKFYCLGLTNVWSYGINHQTWLRNFGIFREPGVYQMYLNLALSFYLNFAEKPKLAHVAIYVLAIISTTSTTGLIGLMIVIIAFVLNSKTISQRVKFISIAFTVIFILFMFSGYSEKLYYAVTKLSDQSNPSTVARFGSIYANFMLWLDRPILGVGISQSAAEFSQIVASRYHVIATDNTNTYMYFLSSFGLVFALVVVVGAFRFSKLYQRRQIIVVLSFVLLLVIFSGENLSYSLLPYIISFYGLLYQPKPSAPSTYAVCNSPL